jgi:ribonuclease D
MGSAPLCLDTEADSMHHYPEKVCLVQLATAGETHLIDPLAGLDLAPLAPALADDARLTILHGADYDLRVLDRDFDLRVGGLFDTMIAARLLGEPAVGLAALVDKHLGVRLDKRYQRADWSRRPLPEPMLHYAAEDTRHLEPLAGRLRHQLQQRGRETWAAEEFRRLEQVRWTENPNHEAFRRIKGAGSLKPRGMAVLRELVALREAEALLRDRPPFKIMHNQVLLQLAEAPPREPSDLARVQGMPQAWCRGGKAQRLLKAVHRAMDLPEDQLPEPPARRRRPKGGRLESLLRRLTRERNRLAEKLEIEPSVLAPRAVLEQVAKKIELTEDPRGVEELRDWQAGLLGPAFDRVSR